MIEIVERLAVQQALGARFAAWLRPFAPAALVAFVLPGVASAAEVPMPQPGWTSVAFQTDGRSSSTARQLLQQMSDSVLSNLKQVVGLHLRRDSKLTPEQRQRALERLDDELAAIVPAMKAVFDDPKLRLELEQRLDALYAKHFTPDELAQLSAFYQTPVGQKLLRTSEPMMRDMEEVLGAVQPRITSQTRVLAQELLARLTKP